MENWSLIFFRETKILVTPYTSSADLMSAARVICHELAHMIFGNLVTMGMLSHTRPVISQIFTCSREFILCELSHILCIYLSPP